MLTRVNYFDKQFLKVEEFKAEQQYHIDARHRLTKAFQQWGVVDQPPVPGVKVTNLEVTKASDTEVKVEAGLAIDATGQEIVLGKSTLLQVPKDVAAKATLYVRIAYQDQFTSAHEWSGDPEQPTRATEGCLLELSGTAPSDSGLSEDGRSAGVPLASFELDEQGHVPGKTGDILAGKVRRHAGTMRLAAGATAAGDFGVAGPLTVRMGLTAKGQINAEDAVVIKGALAASSDVSIGSEKADNSEMWNRNLQIQGAGNARVSLRSHPDPQFMIDGRIQVHGKGWWGSEPGMIIGTATSHDLSFGVDRKVKMTLSARDGVAVFAPFSVKGPNRATFDSDLWVSGGLRTDSLEAKARIASPMWKPTQVQLSAASPLPSSLPMAGELVTTGGTLLVFMNGSGFSVADDGARIGMELSIGDRTCGNAWVFANQRWMHLAFGGGAMVVKDVAAGTHRVELKPMWDTRTDNNDSFSVVVLELPF